MAQENVIMDLMTQPIDMSLPGEGQNYCPHCARYFVDRMTLAVHLTTKGHKKRLKELKTSPHNQQEAEMAAGMGNFVMPTKHTVRNLTMEDQEQDPGYVDRLDEKMNQKIKSQTAAACDNNRQVPRKRKLPQSHFIAVESSAAS